MSDDDFDGYCPDCQSCGVGGCCPYYCDRCKDRHDGDDAEGGESPRNLGDRSANPVTNAAPRRSP